MTEMIPPPIDQLVTAWRDFCRTTPDWQELIAGVEPVHSGCGQIYELDSPLGRPNESFAIADMRAIPYAEPHYHPKGSWECYVVFQGTAAVFVGDRQYAVGRNDAVVIPPDTAHFTLPDNDFVIAAINTPPFRPDHYIALQASDPAVGYDHELFEHLTAQQR